MTTRKLLSVCCIASFVAGVVFAQETVHVLRRGETLYGLSRQYGIGVDSILSANRIADADKIKIGQRIVIPRPKAESAHVTEKGETLYGIARKYGMSIAELRAMNGLDEKSVLKAGDRLRVSAEKPAVAIQAPKNPVPVPVPDTGKQATGAKPNPNPEPRSISSKLNDPSVRWPVRVKELAYMEGKLYGVLLTSDKDERVESLTEGTVVSAETYRGFGRVAIVQAPDGYVYVYGGNESLSVKSGDRVASGAELGRLGVDSLTGKPSLFLFVYKDNIAIDPAKAPRS